MSSDQIEFILKLSCEERYDYFLSKVGEEKEIWVVINTDNKFLKIYAEEDGFEYLPIWPNSDFASGYCSGTTDLTPKGISLPEFFKKWIPGLKRDNLEIGVFPGLDLTVWITEPAELQKDLQDELSSF